MDLNQTEQHWLRRSITAYGSGERLSSVEIEKTKHGSVWIFEADDLVCLAHSRGAACAPRGDAIQNGVMLGVFSPPDAHHRALHNFLVQGLVPDGVYRVLAVIDPSHRVLVDVHRNVFTIAADTPIHVKRLVQHG
jgi:hypothetical protein